MNNLKDKLKSTIDDAKKKMTSTSKENIDIKPDDQVSSTSNVNGNAKSAIPQSNFPVRWSPENEKILVEWCDVAQCYKWLNNRANNIYSRMHAWFTIPAITLSTISGTASFAQASIPIEYQVYAPMVIGSINILIGILTTIQQYLKISELNEAHRVAAIAWDKYARNIRIELAKDPKERADAGLFIKYNRDEYDRLMETCPSIPQNVVEDFKNTFSGISYSSQTMDFCKMCVRSVISCVCCKPELFSESADSDDSTTIGSDSNVNLEDLSKVRTTISNKKEKKRKNALKNASRREMFEKLNKPDICDIIISAEENRHQWYKDPDAFLDKTPLNDVSKDIENQIEMQVSQHYEALIQKEHEFFDEERAKISEQLQEKESMIQKLIQDYQTMLEQEKNEKQLLFDEQNTLKENIANKITELQEQSEHKLSEVQEESVRKLIELQQENERKLTEVQEQARIRNESIVKMWAFVTAFIESMGRKPLDNEIRAEFESKIAENIVQEFVENYK
jgi:hypothetical protein